MYILRTYQPYNRAYLPPSASVRPRADLHEQETVCVPRMVVGHDVVGDVCAQDVVHQERVRLHLREILKLSKQHLGTHETENNKNKQDAHRRTRNTRRGAGKTHVSFVGAPLSLHYDSCASRRKGCKTQQWWGVWTKQLSLLPVPSVARFLSLCAETREGARVPPPHQKTNYFVQVTRPHLKNTE